QLAGPRRGQLPRGELAEAALDGDRRHAGAEQVAGLRARRLVARDQEHGAPPGPAERRVDTRLADEGPVEPEVLPLLAGNRVVHDALGRSGARVHADEERRVTALLEEARVLRPLLLDDELAGRVELFRDER